MVISNNAADWLLVQFTFISTSMMKHFFTFLLVLTLTSNTQLFGQTKVYTQTGFPCGHVWITIGDSVLYSYGNYQRNTGSINSIFSDGGVLLRIQGRMGVLQYISPRPNFESVTLKMVDLSGVLDSMFNSHHVLPTSGLYSFDERARVVGKYRLMKFNCSTFVGELLGLYKVPKTPIGLRKILRKHQPTHQIHIRILNF